MAFRLTSDQMMAPMPPHDVAAWFVAEIMPTEFADFLRDLGPVQCKDQSRNGLYYAEHFGIRRPDLQGQFLTLMWALGPNFFEASDFGAILTDPKLDEARKVDLLYEVSDEAGGQAMLSADDTYWFPWLIEKNILGFEEDPEWAITEDEAG